MASAVLLGTVGLGACGNGSGDAFGVIRERQGTAAYAIERTVPEMLADLSGGVVVVEGTIERVDDGVGMSWTFDDDGENEQRQLLAFDDDAAMVRSVHVTLAVEQVIRGELVAREVRFGVVVDGSGDASALRDGLVGESVVAFLSVNAVFDYEDGLYGVLFDGGLLCRRGAERALECPGLDNSLADALRIAAVRPTDLEPSLG